jgi:signal transduction histidine kinase
MSWLPAVCFAGSRWWLPLSQSAANLIAAALLEQPATKESLISQLKCDPPLAMFAAIRGHGKRQEDQSLRIETLASEILANVSLWFCGGDAFLGAPAEHELFVPKWNELHHEFIRAPRSTWMSGLNRWMEITGPTVPRALHLQLPTIADSSAESIVISENTSPNYCASKLDLSLLARNLRRAYVLQTAFAESLIDTKKAALKQFAYGLSHEINNPLANISARAQGLMRDEQVPARSASLERIVAQSMRAHEMIADLMFYAHPPAISCEEIDLMRVINGVVNQSRASTVGLGIEWIVKDADRVVKMQADRAMMSEAVRALVRNSIEAIGSDGRVEVECCLGNQGEKSIATIFVRDSGPGLSDEARRHAFDPYFSGREAGRGLGVGLCRVERIAKLHGGGVSLLSGPAGCTARLWIPARS